MPLFREPLRPALHYTPPRNWMNDPNGLVYLHGEYHLFYQHNPRGIDWGSISWAHVKSRDLLHWEELPLALQPDSVLGLPFSGSAVFDAHNSSELFDSRGGLVALFTNVVPDNGDFSRQSQSVAFSRDGGVTWTLYEGNPVIPNTGRAHFRDPKVIWHAASGSWVLAVAHEDEVLFFRSSDLLHWEVSGAFGSGRGSHAGIWECPDLLYLPVENGGPGEARWILVVGDGDQAAKNAGGTQYFIGRFDGQTFHCDDPPETVRWVDHGRDFYAAQSWSGIPASQGRTVWIAWMSQWVYSRDVPTSPWRGVMTLPREAALRRIAGELRLRQTPLRELDSLRCPPIQPTGRESIGGEALVFDPQGAVALDLVTSFVSRNGVIRLRYGEGGAVIVRVNLEDSFVEVDRTGAAGGGFSSHFAGAHRASLPGNSEAVDLRLIVDASTLELFLLGGTLTMADLILPTGPLHSIEVTGGACSLYPLTPVR